MREQEIPDVFLKKAPVTASSQRPRRCYGALVTFYRVSTEFFVGDYMRSHGVHIVCTALSRRSHCAFMTFTLRFHGVCTALTA